MFTPCKQIVSSRFTLRPLEVDDVTERYSSWLSHQETSKYITAKLNILELRQYVLERLNRQDVLFLGIFDKDNGLHIGNIKYEPINSKLCYANMGILIGEPSWQGRGVAAEVIMASTNWLFHNRNIKEIILGVHKLNGAAIRAYSKIGFVKTSSKYQLSNDSESITMVWRLPNLDSLPN